jgi:hypothetical protein
MKKPYNTKSGFPDLDGTIYVDNGKVTRYHSNLKGDGMVLGSQLVTNFSVKFSGDPAYHIMSKANGPDEFDGTADDNGVGKRKEQIETWTATATKKGSRAGSAAKTSSVSKSPSKTKAKAASTGAAARSSAPPKTSPVKSTSPAAKGKARPAVNSKKK